MTSGKEGECGASGIAIIRIFRPFARVTLLGGPPAARHSEMEQLDEKEASKHPATDP